MIDRRIHLNGVDYRWPESPVVVVCIDGGDPAYIAQGIRDGIIPSDVSLAEAIIALLAGTPGIAAALGRDEVCRLYELPPDCEGDVAVIGEPGVVIGAASSEHDLSSLGGARLRSHGSVAEAQVPFILSRPLNAAYRHRASAGTLRSHQIFDYALNGTEAAP